MKTIVKIFLIGALLLIYRRAAAQSDASLELRLRRDFGYSAMSTNEIQGTFTLTASGPEDLDFVVFYMDDQPLGRVDQAPYQLRFSTDSYPPGPHVLSAEGQTAADQSLKSNPISVQFVSAGEGFAAGMRFAIPILVLVIAMAAVSTLVTLLGSKKLQSLPVGAPRKYGFAGGAICPRCRRPFSRHVLAPNLVIGKLERCPFCGKWSIVAAASPERLHQAEESEVETARLEEAPAADKDALRKALDDSRYRDL